MLNSELSDECKDFIMYIFLSVNNTKFRKNVLILNFVDTIG